MKDNFIKLETGQYIPIYIFYTTIYPWKNDKEQSEATVEKKLSPVILQTSSSVLL